MFIFYNARFPDVTEPSNCIRNFHSPDCAVRAWSKALECPYDHLLKHFGSVAIDVNNQFNPWLGRSVGDQGVTEKQMKKYEAYCNQNRVGCYFPANDWGSAFGRYIETSSEIRWDSTFAETREWKKYHRKDTLWEFGSHTRLPEFLEKHPEGRFVVCLMPDDKNNHSGHAVCIVDGNVYDTWDCTKSVDMHVDAWYKINSYKIQVDYKRRDPKSKKKWTPNFFDGLVA